MLDSSQIIDPVEGTEQILTRLDEPAPTRIQLLTGPRQVGKTTILLRIERSIGASAIYLAADGPEVELPGWWERLWARAEDVARQTGRAVVLIDEIQSLEDWAAKLKSQWDRIRRLKLPCTSW